MPLTIKVKADATKLRQSLEDVRRQLPYATAVAVNAIAFVVQRGERDLITRTFEHPRPFTQRSVLVDKATKGAPTATVYVRPEVEKYLLPYETGGLHYLPGRGIALLNPKDIGLDQYGQLRKGTTQRLKGKQSVFVGTIQTRGGPVTGFWQRLKAAGATGGRLELLIRFGDDLPVNKSLGFEALGVSLVQKGFSQVFQDAIDKALATAR